MIPGDWWIRWRDREPVRSALAQAHCAYWAEVVDEVLLDNERACRYPQSWTDVAQGMHRHVKNVERWREGRQQNYAPAAYLALSALLGIEASELVPGNLRWVATALRVLTEGQFTTEQCRPLAACVLCQSGDAPLTVDRDLLVRALERYGGCEDVDRAESLANEVLEGLTARLQCLE